MQDELKAGRHELTEEDKDYIREVFAREVAPKLRRWYARTGNLNCAFAGDKYKHWVVRFKSFRAEFDIIDFEYDA
ncbi:hypothetical protein [Desulfotomaculum copahuensis]|uniref:Uncharacterized protein n=1 Tax=Desulfotomaculum copahuensis TaxID=1838280 RepID=A0A1B7LD41_9FIRM|nr:hypothetical protein [Desulfotomaculum copahuensis]OAT80837.1 hypothetical protein A6M21_12240 [Desulfotomaculum copahuensis]